MAYQLTDTSQVFYGGISLNDNPIRTRVTMEKVMDDANRMCKWVRYTFHVKATVLPPLLAEVDLTVVQNTIDVQFAALRQTLSSNGKEFRYYNKGFGFQFLVNGPKGPRDAEYGPRVTLKSFSVFGPGLAAIVEMEIVVAIPECDSPTYKKKIAAETWSWSVETDEQGLSTVTTTGSYEIPLTFINNDRIDDTADKYWESVLPEPLIGYRRTVRRELSMDRRKMNFTITERQLEVAWPEGITHADVRHRTGGALATGFRVWKNTLTATFRTDPIFPKRQALLAFLQVAGTRLAIALSTRGANVAVIPSEISFGETVTNFESHFSLSYDIVGTSLLNIVTNSGMWSPVPFWDHAAWSQSIRNSAQGPRGVNAIAFNLSDDTILDLCTGSADTEASAGRQKPPKDFPPYDATSKPGSGPGPGSETVPGSDVVVQAVEEIVNLFNYSSAELLTPEFTWIRYVSMLRYQADDHVVRHKPLKGKVKVTPPAVDPIINNILVPGAPASSTSPGAVSSYSAGDPAAVTSDVPDTLQRLSAPSATVTLTGNAMRIGYPIAPPRLVKFAGMDMTKCQVHEDVTGGQVGVANGLPVFALFWTIVYDLPKPLPPGGLPTLANPMLLS